MKKHFTKTHFAAINRRTNDIALPSGKKAPGLTFTLQKHYRGRWKCKRIYDQANQNRYFYNQICK
jgi:hypothetical protein